MWVHSILVVRTSEKLLATSLYISMDHGIGNERFNVDYAEPGL